MRRRELNQTEIELINKKEKIDDKKAIDEFIRSRRIKNVRESTIEFYQNALHVLKRDLNQLSINKQLIELTQEDVEEVILFWKQRLKVTSINSKLRGIRPFYFYLQEKQMIKKNPTENIKLLRDRKQIRETLEPSEIKKIAEYLKKQNTFAGFRDSVIFQLLLDTGIRINECLNIKVNDIDGKRLVITESKNLLQRVVYLSRGMQEKLEVYLKVRGDLSHDYVFVNQENRQLQKNTFQGRLRAVAKECGIKKQVSPHVCRRTYAKNAIIKGMDPFSFAVLLGHSTLEVTKSYVQMWGADLENQATKKLDYNGYGTLFVVNTSPIIKGSNTNEFHFVPDAENWFYIQYALNNADVVVLGWGKKGQKNGVPILLSNYPIIDLFERNQEKLRVFGFGRISSRKIFPKHPHPQKVDQRFSLDHVLIEVTIEQRYMLLRN